MRTIWVLFFGLVACGGGPNPTEATVGVDTNTTEADDLEAAFGGPGGLMAFFDDAPDTSIAGALDAHNIGFARHALLTDCNQTFSAADRNTWHAFDGEFYFIEANGRPNRAYKYLPPIVETARIPGC